MFKCFRQLFWHLDRRSAWRPPVWLPCSCCWRAESCWLKGELAALTGKNSWTEPRVGSSWSCYILFCFCLGVVLFVKAGEGQWLDFAFSGIPLSAVVSPAGQVPLVFTFSPGPTPLTFPAFKVALCPNFSLHRLYCSRHLIFLLFSCLMLSWRAVEELFLAPRHCILFPTYIPHFWWTWRGFWPPTASLGENSLAMWDG